MNRRSAKHWEKLVDALAAWLDELRPGPLEQVRIITSSAATARLVGQALAARIGILAGVDLLPVDRWVAQLQAELNDGESSPWRGLALELAIREVLQDPDFQESHPVVAEHLRTGPGRLRGASQRLAVLLRRYSEHHPELLARWLTDPEEAAGELPMHLRWQPELTARVTEILEWDPIEELTRLRAALTEKPGPATAVFHCPDLPAATHLLLDAIGQIQDVPVLELENTAAPERITWLGSHDPLRQAEVLREELCRILQGEPTLEPRDVLVVVPDPAAWWPALSLAFTPLEGSSHPGRRLRFQAPPEARTPNPVLRTLAEATKLRDSRATASSLLDLLDLAPISYRWQLPERDELARLIDAAEIRWGLDAQHRADQGLSGIAQNTWARGLDRLLAGLALAPGSTALPISGVDVVSTSELELIGSLTEVFTRLRRYAATAGSTTIPEWVARARRLLDELIDLPHGEDSLLQEATSRLAQLAEEGASSPVRVTASDFTRLLEQLAAEPTSRMVMGNGNLTVVAPGELKGVGFPVVVLLGFEDGGLDPIPDAIPGVLPDPGQERLEDLLDHARAARHLVVVHQHRSETTDAVLEHPTTLTWLWRRLGVTPELQETPLTAHSEKNFTGPAPSFDATALEMTRRLRARPATTAPASVKRRRAALRLTTGDDTAPMSLDEVARFLRDPAAAFLRERAGIRGNFTPEISDDLPLGAGGLDAWGIRSRLLAAACSGQPPDAAIHAEARRELLPTGPLGGAVLDADVKLVRQLWQQARSDWDRPVRDVPINLECSGLQLTGMVRLRGDELVSISPSDLPRPLFEPWVQLLALAASGIRTRARIHHLRRHYGEHFPGSVTLTPPQEAVARLEVLVRGARLGRSRLIPVPAEPARALAESARERTFNAADWDLPTNSWNSPWAWRPAHWEHFYTGPASELFADPPQEGDPVGPERFGAFGGWALALHSPLLEAAQ